MNKACPQVTRHAAGNACTVISHTMPTMRQPRTLDQLSSFAQYICTMRAIQCQFAQWQALYCTQTFTTQCRCLQGVVYATRYTIIGQVQNAYTTTLTQCAPWSHIHQTQTEYVCMCSLSQCPTAGRSADSSMISASRCIINAPGLLHRPVC